MAFDLDFRSQRDDARRRGGVARLAIDITLVVTLAVIAAHQLLRFEVSRVEPPPLPPERSLAPSLPVVPPPNPYGSWPTSPYEGAELDEIPPELDEASSILR